MHTVSMLSPHSSKHLMCRCRIPVPEWLPYEKVCCGLLIILGQSPGCVPMTPDYLAQHISARCVFIYLESHLYPHPFAPTTITMRSTSIVSVLAALISIASTFPIGHSAYQGRVAARDTARVRSPETPPNLVPRAKPSPERRNHVPRHAPSAVHEQRDHIPRSAPSPRQDRRHYSPRAPEPSPKYERREFYAPRAEPSGVHHRRNEHVPRHESDKTKRSPQDQNVFGNKIEDGLGWDEEQCPAPLSACSVRGAVDADAVECVDLDSDLSSCGGCAADDIACVFFEAPIFPTVFLTLYF